MRKTWTICTMAITTGLLACTGVIAAAQSAQSGQGSQSQPPAPQTDKPKTPEVTPLTLDTAPPVSAEEDAAYKAFQAVPANDSAKRIEAAEAFLAKYPDTRYKSPLYGALTFAYLQVGNTDKMKEYGEKEIALAPNDVSTLAVMAQTLPRGVHGNASEPANLQTLAKAEEYSKQALEITPTLPKPEGLTDEAFASAKNQTLAMAHSGLGLVYIRRGKNADAIPELEQAVKIDPNPDPVNYYLLGMANKSTSHFDDAVSAFNKCFAMNGPLQTTCKAQADDARKLSTTQLSAPK
jgi:tetratricopeptide (TPR) repeat protein